MYGLFICGDLVGTYDDYDEAMLDAFDSAQSEGWEEIEVRELDGEQGDD